MKMKRILVLHLDYQLKTLSVMIFSSLPKKKGLLEQKHKLKEKHKQEWLRNWAS